MGPFARAPGSAGGDGPARDQRELPLFGTYSPNGSWDPFRQIIHHEFETIPFSYHNEIATISDQPPDLAWSRCPPAVSAFGLRALFSLCSAAWRARRQGLAAQPRDDSQTDTIAQRYPQCDCGTV